MMLILLGLVVSNFLSSIFQALLAIAVVSIAICNSGEIHSKIWLYVVLFLLAHSSMSCVRGVVPMCQILLTRVMLGLSLAGKMSLLRMLLYSP